MDLSAYYLRGRSANKNLRQLERYVRQREMRIPFPLTLKISKLMAILSGPRPTLMVFQ
jgi:hypothetical protein